VEDLEHKARRQDVLVDDELIYAYYDQQLPADVCSGYSFERWYREESKKPQYNPQMARAAGGTGAKLLLRLTREELMRHEAAGITTASVPQDHSSGRRGLRRHLPARTR
jgi:ATP-dependent helicase HrpA